VKVEDVGVVIVVVEVGVVVCSKIVVVAIVSCRGSSSCWSSNCGSRSWSSCIVVVRY
jgi:hypothetical protein